MTRTKGKRKQLPTKPAMLALGLLAVFAGISIALIRPPRSQPDAGVFLREYLAGVQRFGDKGTPEKVEAIQCNPSEEEDPKLPNIVECQARITFQRGTASLNATLNRTPEQTSGWRVRRFNLVPEKK